MLKNLCSVETIADEISKLVPMLIRGVRTNIFIHKEITSAQLVVLMNLSGQEEHKIGHLAVSLGVTAATMSGIIERMTKQGYIGRRESSEDRRCTYVYLKPKGEEIIKNFQRAVRKRWKEILIYLTPQERLAYVRLIKKIIKITAHPKKGKEKDEI